MSRVFISYKRNDLDKIIPIKNKIESGIGETCWFDLSGIESTDYFTSVIINAINQAEVVLFMYTHSHALIQDYGRDWTIREITYAMNRNKKIVFINVEGIPLSDWFLFNFGPQQQVDARSTYQLDKLISDIRIGEKGGLISESIVEEMYKRGEDSQFKKNDFKEALKWFVEAANMGHVKASLQVGSFYEFGWGTLRNYSEAAKWYLKAAELGSAKGQYLIGKMFLEGKGVPQGYGMGVKWLREAVRNGSEDAKGALHELGISVEQKG